MAEITAFALRIPREIKTAAEALKGIYFTEWVEKDGRQYGVGRSASSINDALNYLLQVGASHAADWIEKDIKHEESELDFWTQVSQFFLNNPDKKIVGPADFPDGSPLSERMKNWKIGNDDIPNADTSTRDEAFSYLSEMQRVFRLKCEARTALLQVSPVKHSL